MKTLSLDKFQKSRESIVSTGGFDFTIRRPTELDIARSAGVSLSLDFVTNFVVGWGKVCESDLIPGGDPEPVEFNSALFKAWVSDRPDLWEPIAEGVMTAYRSHKEATADRGKA